MNFSNGQFFQTEMEAVQYYTSRWNTILYPILHLYTPAYQHYYVAANKRVLSIRLFKSPGKVYAQPLSERVLKSGNYVKLCTTDKVGHQYEVNELLRLAKGLSSEVNDIAQWRAVESEPPGLYGKLFNIIVRNISLNFNLRRQDAEDIVQDAYIYIHMNRYLTFENVIPAWYFYARKRSLDFCRRKISYDVPDTGYIPAIPMSEAIWAGIAGKSSKVLKLWAEGYRVQDICEVMDMSRGNIEARICRGIKFLRKLYSFDIKLWNRKWKQSK